MAAKNIFLSSGVLIISLSVIVPEKSRGNKKCDKEEEEERHIFGLFGCKMVVTWLYATFWISICSLCRGQHADAKIWSILLFSRFPGVANKKLSYRRVTARCVLSVVSLQITTQQCRNYLYDKS